MAGPKVPTCRRRARGTGLWPATAPRDGSKVPNRAGGRPYTPPVTAATLMNMHIAEGAPLGAQELARIDAHWRAANYLSVGQIYLMANPLLTEPLLPEHVKPRLLGH